MNPALLALARKIPGVSALIAKVQTIERRVKALESWTETGRLRADGPDSFPLQDWWTRSFWEPTVALAIRDHCRPGDVVFDVGCNAGGMALMMSRLVGPRGIVLAFEASPRIVDKTHYNLVHAGCHNVTLFHKAVWRTSGALVNMAPGSHLNDRIEEATTGMTVRTVALDDLAAAGDFRPSFIKMDIEGAELDALRGSTRLLAEVRPILVLEQAPDDMSCHQLLTEAGYVAVDLSSYRRIVTGADFGREDGVANVLFVPQEKVGNSPYFTEAPPVEVASLPAGRFTRATNGDIGTPEPVDLPAGRYLVRTDFTAEGTDNSVFAGLEADGEVVFRYHTYTKLMAGSYTDWVVQLDRPAKLGLYLRFLSGRDATLRWNGATIFRLPGFDGWAGPVME
jgi:FkbM family methyltransferase